MDFVIDPENIELGIVNTSIALIKGVRIPTTSPAKVEELREAAAKTALAYSPDNLIHHPILAGYHAIYKKLGYAPGNVTPAAQSRIELTKKRGRLPKINAAVDVYNTVVVETLVGIGAHDLDTIQFPIAFTRSLGGEKFKPLGSKKSLILPPGDFLYQDAKGLVLARLAADDCDEAKLSQDTKNILMVIEGNMNSSFEYTQQAAEKACKLIIEFCGESYFLAEP